MGTSLFVEKRIAVIILRKDPAIFYQELSFCETLDVLETEPASDSTYDLMFLLRDKEIVIKENDKTPQSIQEQDAFLQIAILYDYLQLLWGKHSLGLTQAEIESVLYQNQLIHYVRNPIDAALRFADIPWILKQARHAIIILFVPSKKSEPEREIMVHKLIDMVNHKMKIDENEKQVKYELITIASNPIFGKGYRFHIPYYSIFYIENEE